MNIIIRKFQLEDLSEMIKIWNDVVEDGTLSAQLQELYGTKEFSVRSIRRMMQFVQEFPDVQIVSPVATQLTWTHITEILTL